MASLKDRFGSMLPGNLTGEQRQALGSTKPGGSFGETFMNMPYSGSAPSLEDYIQSTYGGGAYDLGQATEDYRKKYSPQYSQHGDLLTDIFGGSGDNQSEIDRFNKTVDTSALGLGADQAMGSVEKSRLADVADFQAQAPLAERNLLGSLNRRGLGLSALSGGQGTGALKSLADRFSKNLGNINLGYQDLTQQLQRQKRAGTFDISDFYGNLDLARKQAKSQEADAFDFLGSLTGVAGGFL